MRPEIKKVLDDFAKNAWWRREPGIYSQTYTNGMGVRVEKNTAYDNPTIYTISVFYEETPSSSSGWSKVQLDKEEGEYFEECLAKHLEVRANIKRVSEDRETKTTLLFLREKGYK